MGSELESHERERGRELCELTEALRQSREVLENERDAAERLQSIAIQLISARGAEALCQQILEAAVAIMHADFALLQKYCPERGTNGELRFVGHRGLNDEAAKRWEWVRPTTCSSCGEALRTGQRAVIPDVRNCDFMSGTAELEELLATGILSVQSTPLVSRSGALLGMVSTQWREPHATTATEERAIDVLSRLAADLMERSWAEEKLSESEEHLKRAERLAHIGHWQWDILTNRVSGSEEMFRMFGKPPEYVPSYEGFLQDLLLEDRERFEQLIGDSLAAKVGHSMEYRVAHPNGDLRTISCVWELLLDEEGTAVRMFGTCQDITDARRAQEESFARQKLETLGTLANGIAHDFNNLLGGVLAQAELAVSEFAGGSSPEEQLKAICKVAIDGAEIVRQLMIYSGKESAVTEPVDISRIVWEMLELLKVSLSKHVVLETNLGQDLPPVRANAAQIRQIVMNLVTNASDAVGDHSGVIRVSTRFVNARRNSPRLELRDGAHLLLKVSDTGPGMTPETQAKVFDPFFTTKSAGRGLGLAVVDRLVRGLGGEVILTSAPGKGARFQILLPCLYD